MQNAILKESYYIKYIYPYKLPTMISESKIDVEWNKQNSCNGSQFWQDYKIVDY